MDSAGIIAATAADGSPASPREKARSRGSRLAKAAIQALKKGSPKRASGAATSDVIAPSPTTSLSDASPATVDRKAAAGNDNGGARSSTLPDSSVNRSESLSSMPSSPAGRNRGCGRLRMEALLASGGSPDLPLRRMTSNNPSTGARRRGLGGAAIHGDDDDEECGDLTPRRQSLDLPPRDFSREDRSRRVSPRPVDRVVRTSTGRSGSSSSESGAIGWVPPPSGADEGTTPRSGSLRSSAEPRRASREWPVQQSTDSACSRGATLVVSCPRMGGQVPVARLCFGDGDGDGGGSGGGGGENGVRVASFVSPPSDSLQTGGVEGELFGGVVYRRGDFRNLTLEEERASIHKSNALPLLPPIGELPSTDPE